MFPGQPLRGMYGLPSLLGARETSALSFIIFFCKAEEFGGRSRGGWWGTEGESNSVPVIKALYSLLVIPL